MQAPPGRPLVIGLLIVLAVATAVRVVYFHQASRTHAFPALNIDSRSYDMQARGWLEGSWPGNRVYFQDPLYPYVLGLQYRLVGIEPARVIAVQLAVGVASAVVVFLLAASVFGLPEGIIAGLLAAVYPVFLFYEGLILKAYLGTFLVTAALLVLIWARRQGAALAALAGSVYGLACLVRGNLLLVLPVALVWLAWPVGSVPLQVRLRRMAMFLLGVLLALMPVTIHNLRAGDWVLTTAQAGQNFYAGNNPSNDTGTYVPPALIRAHPFYEEEDWKRIAEQEIGRPLKPSEVSRFWFRKGLEFVRSQPGRAARLLVLKAGVFFNRVEVPDNASFPEARKQIPVLGIPVLPTFWGVLVLGVVGIVLHRWRFETVLLVSSLAVMAVSVILFYVYSRYRLVVVPVLLVFAASAPRSLALRVHNRQWARLGLAAAAALMMALISWQNVYQVKEHNLSYNRAVDAVRDSDPELALRELDRAVEIKPGFWQARLLRASLLVDLGRLDEAEAELQRVTLPEHHAEGHQTLGRYYAARGHHRVALEAFDRALALQPTDQRSVIGASMVEVALGMPERAMQRLEKFLSETPAAQVYNQRGVLQGSAGRLGDAERSFREALRLDPKNTGIRFNLALCLEAQRRLEEAYELYQEILNQDPAFVPARDRKRALEGRE